MLEFQSSIAFFYATTCDCIGASPIAGRFLAIVGARGIAPVPFVRVLGCLTRRPVARHSLGRYLAGLLGSMEPCHLKKPLFAHVFLEVGRVEISHVDAERK